MSETVIVANGSEIKIAPATGKFERYLTLWGARCFIADIALGQAIPAVFRAIGAATVAEANLPVTQLFIKWLFKSYLPHPPVQELCRWTHHARDRPLPAMVSVWSKLCHIAPRLR